MTNQTVRLTVIRLEKQRMSYISLLVGLAVQVGVDTGKEKILRVTTLKLDTLEENS